ncbi:hypothetical protein HPULCUR_000820 [Helicostylum pulchrum]|uniref:Transposase n=1 Tax=Helicostylum pulchrum TaxID=562976 RepID=A0ABP9XKY3_9FUNG
MAIYHVSLHGPHAGVIHDQAILNNSSVMDILIEHLDCRERSGAVYAIYGDPAYVETTVLIKPFRNSEITFLVKCESENRSPTSL